MSTQDIESLAPDSGRTDEAAPSSLSLVQSTGFSTSGKVHHHQHKAKHQVASQVPDSILRDPVLQSLTSALPSNYDFEIAKTVHRIRLKNAKRVALQFPEGLLMYACIISDILEQYCNVETVIMGDVTYGACCVDDFSAKAMHCDFFVHYGHSCLIPINVTQVDMLYVFVDIKFDLDHFLGCVKQTFEAGARLCIAGTVQFVSSIQQCKQLLKDSFAEVFVPQRKPLSPGEVLGCTSPKLNDYTAIVFVADGRFHLESIMVSNPHIPAYLYDPYSKKFTREQYDHQRMYQLRQDQIKQASQAQTFGVILGTLGRQGSPSVLQHLLDKLVAAKRKYFLMLLSEIYPTKLKLLKEADAFIQVACPRLSMDWGHHFAKPLLNPYETMVALNMTTWQPLYPMDFYSKDGGEWTVYYEDQSRQTAQSSSTVRAHERLAQRRAQLKAAKLAQQHSA